jgi:hypothetical protein
VQSVGSVGRLHKFPYKIVYIKSAWPSYTPYTRREGRGDGNIFTVRRRPHKYTARNAQHAACAEGIGVITQELVDKVFAELQRLGQCWSRDEFSRDWLGREKSYYRSLLSKKRKAGAEAQLNLAGRLRTFGMRYARSEQPAVREIGVTYLQFYAELIDALLAG